MTDFHPDYPIFGDKTDPSAYRGALAIPEDATGRILLQQRDDIPGIVAPGLWGLFGGEIEPGETPVEAVQRELEEEIGIAVPAADFRPFLAMVSTLPPHGLLYVHRVKATFGARDVRVLEGSGFAFCTPRQARALDLIPHLRDVLEELWRRDTA